MGIPLALETVMILLIDLGTDLAPAIAVAYEEPEDAIMQQPPRSKDSHLVGFKMMCVAYCTIGVFETIACFHAFFFTFAFNGFEYDDLTDAGLEYRFKYENMHGDRQAFFRDLCWKNRFFEVINATSGEILKAGMPWYDYDKREYVNYAGTCEGDGPTDFRAFRIHCLERAQSSFMLTVVWGQIGNILIRKTTFSSIFLCKPVKKFVKDDKGKLKMDNDNNPITEDHLFVRLTDNVEMLWSVLFEFFLILVLLWVPGFNNVFGFRSIGVEEAVIGLYALPWLVVWDELRKWYIRYVGNKGVIADWTVF